MNKFIAPTLILLGTISTGILLGSRSLNTYKLTDYVYAEDATPTVQPTQAPQQNLYNTLSSQGDLTQFTQAINRTDLRNNLNSSDNYTIVAPTDNAVSTFYSSGDPGSQQPLENLARYHIVSGNNDIGSLQRQGNVSSIMGQNLVFDGGPHQPTINHFLILRTIPTSNGIIYVIPWVLVPPTVRTVNEHNIVSYQDQDQNHYVQPVQNVQPQVTPRPTYQRRVNPHCRVRTVPQGQQYSPS